MIDTQLENNAHRVLGKPKGLKARPEEIAAKTLFMIARNQAQANAGKIKTYLKNRELKLRLKRGEYY